MVKKIDHIGIMVRDIDASVKQFAALGLTMEKRVVAEDFNCEIAFLPCGELTIELVRPLGPGKGMDFLNTRGEGLHHICFDVEDLYAAHSQLGRELELREDGIKIGAEGKEVFFIKPESLNNVLTEYTTV